MVFTTGAAVNMLHMSSHMKEKEQFLPHLLVCHSTAENFKLGVRPVPKPLWSFRIPRPGPPRQLAVPSELVSRPSFHLAQTERDSPLISESMLFFLVQMDTSAGCYKAVLIFVNVQYILAPGKRCLMSLSSTPAISGVQSAEKGHVCLN